jgi:TctA family transporter
MTDIVVALVAGAGQVVSGHALPLMLLGIGIGFVVGILPGLGGPATLALLLPVTFTMQPVEAFAFLLGMAAVTATTGDITSVLFGVPGEAISAATVVDGHPMAKQGAAGRALGAALMSSLVGAILGAVSLALAIAAVRPLVLLIGYGEFFMLSVLGVTLVAALSGDALVKGLTAGALGLLLATVGLDANTSIQRYTFGQLFLWDGVGLVPVVMGLFAIPEVIDLAVKGTSIGETQLGRLGGVLEGVKDTFRHWALVLRCSVLGTAIGVIPGMGAPVAQWVAYAHAVQSSSSKQRFGHGAVEGVLGPGAANNSALGGALVPTIAFGVPGSTMMAILLGAFLIQGLVPGPGMLRPERDGGHLALTFSFVWIIIASNIITAAVCFLILRQLARITQVRASLVVPLVLLLVYVGTFAEKNAFEDLVLMAGFGVVGWLMVRLEWPRPPLLLGLVLGPILENNLFLATSSDGASWLRRPGVLVIAALIAVGLAYSVHARRARAGARSAPTAHGPAGFHTATLASVAVVAIFSAALWQMHAWTWRSSLFPLAVALPGLALAVAQVAIDWTGAAAAATAAEPAEREKLRRLVQVWLTIGGVLAAIWLLGFPLAALVTTTLYVRVVGGERWSLTLAVALATFLLFGGVFECALHMPFPEGLLGVGIPLPCGR